MRAVLVETPGDIDALTIGEVPAPNPGRGEVLVRTIACGVNRADVLQRQGHYPPPPGVTDIIGLEASGIVESVGEGVTRWRPGDAVVALLAGGGYAEYFVAPEGQLLPPPPGVDLVSAAGVLEVAATVISNLDLANLCAGETFLVHGGAGGIGTFATQYAKALGATVVTTASPEKHEHCLAHGADYAFDYHQDWLSELKRNVGGADVVLDIIGAKYLESNVSALKTGGRIVVIGLQGGIKGTLNLAALLAKQATLQATSLRFKTPAQKSLICTRVEEIVWPMIRSGHIRLSPETRIPFEQVKKAHQQLTSGDNIGKIILTH